MVTTRSHRPSSSAAPDHNPSHSVRRRSAANPSSAIMPAASQSCPSSSWSLHSSSASRAFHHPPISHFVSLACFTRIFSCHWFVVCCCPTSRLSGTYAALSGLVVHVCGIPIPLIFHFISAALGLAPIRSGNLCELVPDFLPRRQLVNQLYVSQLEELPTELSSGMMSQWTHTLYMLMRNYLNPTSQHGKVS
ncbi:unnamed protein product [Prunus brigantina]